MPEEEPTYLLFYSVCLIIFLSGIIIYRYYHELTGQVMMGCMFIIFGTYYVLYFMFTFLAILMNKEPTIHPMPF